MGRFLVIVIGVLGVIVYGWIPPVIINVMVASTISPLELHLTSGKSHVKSIGGTGVAVGSKVPTKAKVGVGVNSDGVSDAISVGISVEVDVGAGVGVETLYGSIGVTIIIVTPVTTVVDCLQLTKNKAKDNNNLNVIFRQFIFPPIFIAKEFYETTNLIRIFANPVQ